MFGCTGQNIEGAWRGPFPFDGAEDCLVKVQNNGSFTLGCREDVWVGAGKWRRQNNRLELDFVLLTHRGEAVRQRGEPLQLRLDGAGNTLCVGLPTDNGEPYCWRRELP